MHRALTHYAIIGAIIGMIQILASQSHATDPESCAEVYARFRDAKPGAQSIALLPELERWKSKQTEQFDQVQCAVMRIEAAADLLRKKLKGDLKLRFALQNLTETKDHCSALSELYFSRSGEEHAEFCGPSAGDFDSVEEQLQKCTTEVLAAESRVRNTLTIRALTEYQNLLPPRARCLLKSVPNPKPAEICADCESAARREVKILLPRGTNEIRKLSQVVANQEAKLPPAAKNSTRQKSQATDVVTAPAAGQGADVAGTTVRRTGRKGESAAQKAETTKKREALARQITLAVQEELKASEETLRALEAAQEKDRLKSEALVAQITQRPVPQPLPPVVTPPWRARKEVIQDAERTMDQWLAGQAPKDLGKQILDLEFHASPQLERARGSLHPKLQTRWAKTMASFQARSRDPEEVLRGLVAEFSHTYNREEGANLANAVNGEGGNCSLNAKIDIAAFTQLGVPLAPNEVLGVQQFTDHLAAVIVKKTDKGIQVRDLYSGEIRNEVISPILHPAVLLRGLLKTLDGNARQIDEFVLYRPDGEKRDAYQKEILARNLASAPNLASAQVPTELKTQLQSAVDGRGILGWIKQIAAALKPGAIRDTIATFIQTGKLPAFEPTNDLATFEPVGGEISYGLGKENPRFSEHTYAAPHIQTPLGQDVQKKSAGGASVEQNPDLDAKGLVAYLTHEGGMVTRRILPRGEKYDPTRYPANYAASNQTLLTDYSVSVNPHLDILAGLQGWGKIDFKNSADAERFKAISSSVGRMRFLRALAQKDLLETTQRIFSDSDLNTVAQTLRNPESTNPAAALDMSGIPDRLLSYRWKVGLWGSTLSGLRTASLWIPLDGEDPFRTPEQLERDPEIARAHARLMARVLAIRKYATQLKPEEIAEDLKSMESSQIAAYWNQIQAAHSLPAEADFLQKPNGPDALAVIKELRLKGSIGAADAFLAATTPEYFRLSQRDPQGKQPISPSVAGTLLPRVSSSASELSGSGTQDWKGQVASRGKRAGNLRYREKPLLEPATHDRKMASQLAKEFMARASKIEEMRSTYPGLGVANTELFLEANRADEALRARSMEFLTPSALQDLSDEVRALPDSNAKEIVNALHFITSHLEDSENALDSRSSGEKTYDGLYGRTIGPDLLELEVTVMRKLASSLKPIGKQDQVLKSPIREFLGGKTADPAANAARLQKILEGANLGRPTEKAIDLQYFEQTVEEFLRRAEKELKRYRM